MESESGTGLLERPQSGGDGEGGQNAGGQDAGDGASQGDRGAQAAGSAAGAAAGSAVAGPAGAAAGSAAGGAAAGAASQVAEQAERAGKTALLLIAALQLLPYFLILIGVSVLVSLLAALNPFGGGGGDGEWSPGWPVSSDIPAVYQPMYEAASKEFGVNKFLLASIHKQETGFSTNLAARAGTNAWGAAGPMQFLLPTWRSYMTAFRRIQDQRPKSYPLDRRKMISCVGVPKTLGCVYDDFDAIAGAAAKLRHDGADQSLTSKGTHAAVCAYIGACSEVDKCTSSVNQYCQVLPRARKWELEAGEVTGDGSAASKAVAWALSQDGVEEQPLGSDCGGPITAWQRHAGRYCGVPWCGTFVHEAYLHAGINLPEYLPSVPATWDHIKAGDGILKRVPISQMKRGDIVIFQWDSGVPDHMGLVAADYDGGGHVHTIEGNTSQGVHRRNQPLSVIVGVGRVAKGS